MWDSGSGKGKSGKRIAVELKREIQNGTKIGKKEQPPLFLSQLRPTHPSIHPSIHPALGEYILVLKSYRSKPNFKCHLPSFIAAFAIGERGLGKCAVQTKGKKDAHKTQSLLLVLLIFSFHFISSPSLIQTPPIYSSFIIHHSSPPTYVPSFLSLIRLPFHCHLPHQLYSPVIYFSPGTGRDGNKKKAPILNTKAVSFLFGFRFPF